MNNKALQINREHEKSYIPGRPLSATVEEKALDVSQSFVKDQRLSIRKAVQQHDTNRMQRILKQIKFHLYKIYLVQKLK